MSNASSLTKVTNSQWRYIEFFRTEYNQNQSRNVENKCRKSFTLLNKLWRSKGRFMTNLKLPRQLYMKKCYIEFHEHLLYGFDASTG